MASKSNETALATISSYAILDAQDGISLSEIMEANMGGDGALTQFDLDRIGMPTGGVGRFSIPTLDEPDLVTEFEGVIVAQRKNRAYWSDPEPKQGQQPDCFSDDGVTGYGNPGGDCASCPLAQFGSDPKGSGQACKLTNPLFILRKDDLLPAMLNVPPSSLKGLQKYRIDLTKRRKRITDVVTKMSLEKASSNTGIAYHTVKFSVVEDIPAEQRGVFAEYGSTITALLQRPSGGNYTHDTAPASGDVGEPDEEEVEF